jgi:hypothetical protein
MENAMLFWHLGILADQSILFPVSSFCIISLFRVCSHFLSLASSINVPVCLSPSIPSLDLISKCPNPEAMTVTSFQCDISSVGHTKHDTVAFVYTWPVERIWPIDWSRNDGRGSRSTTKAVDNEETQPVLIFRPFPFQEPQRQKKENIKIQWRQTLTSSILFKIS